MPKQINDLTGPPENLCNQQHDISPRPVQDGLRLALPRFDCLSPEVICFGDVVGFAQFAIDSRLAIPADGWISTLKIKLVLRK